LCHPRKVSSPQGVLRRRNQGRTGSRTSDGSPAPQPHTYLRRWRTASNSTMPVAT
jgi:hypothetical protein